MHSSIIRICVETGETREVKLASVPTRLLKMLSPFCYTPHRVIETSGWWFTFCCLTLKSNKAPFLAQSIIIPAGGGGNVTFYRCWIAVIVTDIQFELDKSLPTPTGLSFTLTYNLDLQSWRIHKGGRPPPGRDLPSSPLLSLFLPLRSSVPLNQLGSLGSAVSSPVGPGAEPQPKN